MCGLTMWDSRETDHEWNVRGMVANSPTMDTLMETRCRWLSKLSAMEESRSPRMLGAWCTTAEPGRPQQTPLSNYIRTLKELGFEEEKGQLRNG
jgi:hypothetical protein